MADRPSSGFFDTSTAMPSTTAEIEQELIDLNSRLRALRETGDPTHSDITSQLSPRRVLLEQYLEELLDVEIADAADEDVPLSEFEQTTEFENGLAELETSDIMATQAVQGSQLQTIPTYDGLTNVKEFIRNIDRAKEQFNWSSEATAAAVKSKLTGEAYSWLRTKELQFDDGTKIWETANNVDGLRILLRDRFSHGISALTAAEALSDLKQKPMETVDTFFDRCYLAADKMNHLVKDETKRTKEYKDQTMATVATFFAAGLKDVYKARVIGSADPPTSAEDMLKACRHVELETMRKKEVDVVEAGPSSHGASGGATAPAQEPSARTQAQDEKIASLEKEVAALKFGSKAGITCYTCGGKGHFQSECPTNRSSRGYNNRGRNPSRPRVPGRFNGKPGKFSKKPRPRFDRREANEVKWDVGTWDIRSGNA